MKHRFTNKQLQDKNAPEYLSDALLLNVLINERLAPLVQGTPLYDRLRELRAKLPELIQTTIP